MARRGGTPENLKSYKPGETGNPNGRPRKFVSKMDIDGYKKAEIDTTIRNILAMTETEIKNVWKDPRATILEKAFAQTMIKAKSYGDVWKTEQLLTRTFGSPIQRIEEDLNIKVSWEDPDNTK